LSSLCINKLKQHLGYNPDTGLFVRYSTGDVAGHQNSDGYVYIRIFGKRYLAHRLAWFYVHGQWPVEIDHKDTIKNHNWISNLRPSTRSQNMSNIGLPKHNSSGIKGVCWDKTNEKWLASIQVDKKFKNLGRFKDKGEAIKVRRKAEIQYFGEYARPAGEDINLGV